MKVESVAAYVPFPEAPAVAVRPRPRTLETMFADHCDFVFRNCRRLGLDEGAAEDATQQVFIVASKKLESIAIGAERAFLFATASNIVSNMRRSVMRRREDAVEIERVDDRALPDDLLDQARARRVVDQVLEGMDLDLRTAFVLFEVEQLTFTEMAELLAIPRGTVASRVRRAREDFERAVKRILGGGGLR